LPPAAASAVVFNAMETVTYCVFPSPVGKLTIRCCAGFITHLDLETDNVVIQVSEQVEVFFLLHMVAEEMIES
jgi:hypothetical protein